MDPFFVRPKRRAEDMVSSESGEQEAGEKSESEVSETPNEKRVRLAREMIETLRGDEEDPDEEENVAKRLHKAAAQAQGGRGLWLELGRKLAGTPCEWASLVSGGANELEGGIEHIPTCLALRDGMIASAAKGGSMAVHDASASCVWRGAGDGRSDVAAVCWAGARVLCSARKGESAVRLTEVKGEGEGESEGRLLRGHGKAVTALCCDESGSEVYAASMDGTLRAFDVKTGVCLGTHFGHQQQVNQMVWIAKDRVLTCSEDKTVHLWKLDEDQQAVYRGPSCSIECVAVLVQRGNAVASFVSGQQDGSLALWSAARKKPVFTLPLAHGGRWIVSVAALRHSDLIASGSCDGFVRLWHYTAELSLLRPVAAIPTPGFVNALALHATSGLEERLVSAVLLCALGTEHRQGRWWSTKKDESDLGSHVCQGAVNAVFSYPLVLPNDQDEE